VSSAQVYSLLNGLIAVVAGVLGTVAFFYVLNALVGRLPKAAEQRLRPYVFVGPAVLVLILFLLIPAADTVRRSFQDSGSQGFVGIQNYIDLFTDPTLLIALRNNVLWMIVVPVLSVAVGLAVAVLADRLSRRGESFTKSLIFLPMAISFVGASTIWGFIYAWRPEGRPQIGLLNEVVVAFGGSPVPWLQTAGINNFALMIIMVWLQAGFAMVLLSAAIKNVPEDTIEAARIDGASEVQVFSRVVVPQIRSTMVVVATTILILVLKIFDIVRVLTNGRDGTDVVANRFINEFFTFREFGRASVLVVALIIATIPFMILNVRRFREQEAMR
jgi:alpha-glucoside transport system permease protein